MPTAAVVMVITGPARAARDERTIRFAWTVGGVESTVQFELAEDEGGTLVTLSQSDLPTFAEGPADTAGARGAVDVLVAGDRQPGGLSARPRPGRRARLRIPADNPRDTPTRGTRPTALTRGTR